MFPIIKFVVFIYELRLTQVTSPLTPDPHHHHPPHSSPLPLRFQTVRALALAAHAIPPDVSQRVDGFHAQQNLHRTFSSDIIVSSDWGTLIIHLLSVHCKKELIQLNFI